MGRPSIVIATRELDPLAGGGVAPGPVATLRALAGVADATLVTSPAAAAAVDLDGLDVVLADEPPRDGERSPGYQSWAHAWSDALHRAIRGRFGDAGPDLLELPDRGAEAFVALQARRTGERSLARTRIVVRLVGTGEVRDVLDGSLSAALEAEVVRECERYCLRRADALLHPGGDVAGAYERYYGADALAPRRLLPAAIEPGDVPAAGPRDAAAAGTGALRLLCLGPLERRLGQAELVRALQAIGGEG
ncbi:MAG TPA: hypothetical protein VHB30_02230, partial [Solirubrobacteraceae bacterium]|nr:hypothetical protein [Solirubrobacteraceae bacterium]